MRRQIVAHVGVVVGDQDTRAPSSADATRVGDRDGASVRTATRRSSGSQRSASSTYGMAPIARRSELPRGRDAFGGQVRCPRPDRHGERRAAAFLARDRDAAAMQAGQLLHQRQADAGAFVGPRATVLDAVEPLEHARQIGLGDADAGIGDAQLDAIAVPIAVDT